jgi:hypothetical protein
MTLYFQSDARLIDPQNVVVLASDNVSYSFNTTFQLNLGEQITFYTNWTARASFAGAYNVSLSAMSEDPDVDQYFRSAQDAREVRVVEDVPLISGFAVSGSYSASEIDPQGIYLYPDREIIVSCNASSASGMKNLTTYFSTDHGLTWASKVMTEVVAGEWIASLPKQADGASLRVYVIAFDLLEKSSKTGEFVFQVTDLQALDVRSKAVAASMVTTIVACCGVYLLWRRRKMDDVL